jgi:hypothetical protein
LHAAEGIEIVLTHLILIEVLAAHVHLVAHHRIWLAHALHSKLLLLSHHVILHLARWRHLRHLVIHQWIHLLIHAHLHAAALHHHLLLPHHCHLLLLHL